MRFSRWSNEYQIPHLIRPVRFTFSLLRAHCLSATAEATGSLEVRVRIAEFRSSVLPQFREKPLQTDRFRAVGELEYTQRMYNFTKPERNSYTFFLYVLVSGCVLQLKVLVNKSWTRSLLSVYFFSKKVREYVEREIFTSGIPGRVSTRDINVKVIEHCHVCDSFVGVPMPG